MDLEHLPSHRDPRRPSPRRLAGLALLAVAAVLAFSALTGSYYTVNPSERAFVRVFGTPTTKEPIGPGLHFKVPFVSNVDKLQISQTALEIESFAVNTIDNQQVTLKIDIQYTVPESDVYRLLYQVGQTGSADIDEPIKAIVKDRVSRIFSSKNTNTVSENREKIQEDTQTFVKDALANNFGIDLTSLQIAEIRYSEAFVQSNGVAVLAKNRAIQEENQLKVVQYQAQQKVIEAQGVRDQQIAAAEGRNRSTILDAEAKARSTELQATALANAKTVQVNAEAKAQLVQADSDKKAAELRGAGDAFALKASVDALGGADKFTAYQLALAQKNWNGNVPVWVTSDKGGPQTFVPLTMPKAPPEKGGEAQ